MFFLFLYYTTNNKNSQYVFKKYILLFTAFFKYKKNNIYNTFYHSLFFNKKIYKKNKLKNIIIFKFTIIINLYFNLF